MQNTDFFELTFTLVDRVILLVVASRADQSVGGGAAALEFRHRPLPCNAGKPPPRPGRDGGSPADTYSEQLSSVNWRF